MRGALRSCNDDINSKHGECGETALHFAADGGHKEVVQLILEDERVEVNAKDVRSYTPLHFAAQEGHSGIVQLLLEDERVDVNSKTENGYTPLHSAAVKDNHEIVCLLLNSPSLNTANHVGDDGRAPVMVALQCASNAVFRELVNHRSVDLSTTDGTGKSLDTVARSVFQFT